MKRILRLKMIFEPIVLEKKKVVRPPGVEPGTPTFVVLYSIQLSYGRIEI